MLKTEDAVHLSDIWVWLTFYICKGKRIFKQNREGKFFQKNKSKAFVPTIYKSFHYDSGKKIFIKPRNLLMCPLKIILS